MGPSCLHLYLNVSVMLGNYLQQTTSVDVIFSDAFFLALLGLGQDNLVCFFRGGGGDIL